MANRYFQQFQGTLEHGIVKLFGVVTTGTSGAIDSSDCKGFTVVKTAAEAGRYTVTLNDNYFSLRNCTVTLVGSSDAAYTASKGIVPFLRNVSVSNSSKTFDVQFSTAVASPADAEIENGAAFYLEITVKNSSAY